MRKTTVTRDQARDTGMAMVLLMLLGQVTLARGGFLIAAILLHLVNMIAPQVFRPVAIVWLGLSHLIGLVMSRILLSLVYALVVMPVGLLRRVAGKDSMQLRAFKTSADSVMVARNHRFVAGDLEKPY
jgi:hypothetical protein